MHTLSTTLPPLKTLFKNKVVCRVLVRTWYVKAVAKRTAGDAVRM